jgi:hypothetical protein
MKKAIYGVALIDSLTIVLVKRARARSFRTRSTNTNNTILRLASGLFDRSPDIKFMSFVTI